jgi:hypothetical protein
MPSRVIRESALNSPTLAKLSHGAERLFWRLTIIADDAGRFDAHPTVVKARCFPLLVDTLKTADVVKFMSELAADCICLYTVEGRDYGYFRNWVKYQRVYGNASKFPQPPAECGNLPQVPADSCSYSYPISENRESILDISEPRVADAPILKVVSKPKAVKRPLPTDFTFDDRSKQMAEGRGLNVHAELSAFKDRNLATGATYIDWQAAFRNWLRNAVKFAAKGGR